MTHVEYALIATALLFFILGKWYGRWTERDTSLVERTCARIDRDLTREQRLAMAARLAKAADECEAVVDFRRRGGAA